MAFGSGNNSNATSSSKQLTASSSSSSSAGQLHVHEQQSHHQHNHHVHPHHHHHHHHHHAHQQQHHGGVPPPLASTQSSLKGNSSSNTYWNVGCFPNDQQQQGASSSNTAGPPPLPPHHHHSVSSSSFIKQPEFGGEKRAMVASQQQGPHTHQYNQLHHLFLQQQQHNRDLTPSERLLLDQIRSRKAELLKEIAQLQDEIDSVSRELVLTKEPSSQTLPEPDLLGGGVGRSIESGVEPPLADVELDNLSEHSNEQDGGRVASGSSVLSIGSTKDKDRLKIMSLGCKKFNMDPKKGIEFLVTNALLNKDDEMDFAVFLYRGEGLNKTAIGDYLGEKSEFNERVLKAFVGLHDFTDLILVQALRQFLWSFRLPGEAQKIDRMMECFAQRYCQNNPDIFTNTDTCYVLSFAIIMLNTSLHNPSVKDKPTVDTFISMNRGINNGGDLPRELLISLYNSIQSEPFKIPEDDGNDLMHTFFNPDKEGWLWKQGGRYKTWKRRWFILNDNCLYYFEFTTDKEPRGIIPLENVNVREIDDSKSRQKYCFELYATDGSDVIKACKTDSDGRVVEGKHSVYRMSAASSEERDSWVKALRQSISYSPFYEILRKTGGGAGNSTSSLRTGAL